MYTLCLTNNLPYFISFIDMETDSILSSYIKYLTQKGMKIYLITDEDAPKIQYLYGTAIVPYLCLEQMLIGIITSFDQMR